MILNNFLIYARVTQLTPGTTVAGLPCMRPVTMVTMVTNFRLYLTPDRKQ